MNERIKELLSLPGLERLNDWASIGPVQKAALEEFAELIVQECVNTLNQQYVTIFDDADPKNNKTWIGSIMNTTVARCKHSILSNFGV